MIDNLLDLCVRFAHKIEDQEQTIEELQETIKNLQEENNYLRLRHKMFTKNLLNQLYGNCYVDTDSIKRK